MEMEQLFKALVLEPSTPGPKAAPRYDSIAIKRMRVARPLESQHVLIKVAAASLNHRDLYIREGQYPQTVPDSVLGSDAAGTIAELGPGCSSRLRIGARVVVNPTMGWISDPEKPEDLGEFGILGMLPKPGAFAECLVVHESNCVEIPEHMSFVDAAALPCAGVTAYRGVVTLGGCRKGSRVLVPGIGGGVALFALQFARALGAEVWVTSSSDEKISRAVQELDAAGGVNYKREDWAKELETESGGFFDLIVDGAAGNNMKSYIRLLAPGGTLCIYGAVSGSSGSVNFPYLWFKHLTVKGVCMGSLKEFNDMVRLCDEAKIKPVIASVHQGLENAEAAFQEMCAGRQFGKLVLDIAGGRPSL